MEKNRALTHSLNHTAYLMPREPKLALRNKTIYNHVVYIYDLRPGSGADPNLTSPETSARYGTVPVWHRLVTYCFQWSGRTSRWIDSQQTVSSMKFYLHTQTNQTGLLQLTHRPKQAPSLHTWLGMHHQRPTTPCYIAQSTFQHMDKFLEHKSNSELKKLTINFSGFRLFC